VITAGFAEPEEESEGLPMGARPHRAAKTPNKPRIRAVGATMGQPKSPPYVIDIAGRTAEASSAILTVKLAPRPSIGPNRIAGRPPSPGSIAPTKPCRGRTGHRRISPTRGRQRLLARRTAPGAGCCACSATSTTSRELVIEPAEGRAPPLVMHVLERRLNAADEITLDRLLTGLDAIRRAAPLGAWDSARS
jgi:hypothetical protein